MSDLTQNMPGRPEDDLLSTVLGAYQLRAGVYAVPRLCAEWQFGTSGDGRASFHLIGEGECWVHTHTLPSPVRLSAGDLVLFPKDDWHLLSGMPQLNGTGNRLIMSGDGPFSSPLCGYFEFTAGRKNPILDVLPSVLVIRHIDALEPLKVLSKLLMLETHNDAIGTKSVIDKLCDALFVMVLRQYLLIQPQTSGLLAALVDPRIRCALDAIHREPAKDWTIDLLAEAVNMSKTAFSNRFSELLGTTPKEYVTRWRMTQAELMLKNPATSVAAAAACSGYESEAAFRKAFKRLFGIGPRATKLKR